MKPYNRFAHFDPYREVHDRQAHERGEEHKQAKKGIHFRKVTRSHFHVTKNKRQDPTVTLPTVWGA
jgi:hypothetical protein